MAKPRKSSARSKKKTAGKASGKSRKKTPVKAKAKPRGHRKPAVAKPTRTSAADLPAPTVSYACSVTNPPEYKTAPSGLEEMVHGIPEFAAVVPRGRIIITVEPEPEE